MTTTIDTRVSAARHAVRAHDQAGYIASRRSAPAS